MCRNALSAKGLTKVITEEEKNAIVASSKADAAAQQPKEELERKSDALFRILKENPAGRFLVFSRYDNPFVAMEQNIEALGIRVRQLKGNKDAVAATLRAFQGGETRCLLLNSHYAGSGLNITAATHVILLHAMTHEEEKQILGRAYRMGRTEPLSFIRLLHADEMPASN
jgi:SNF2 family DNA or RNA helicase